MINLLVLNFIMLSSLYFYNFSFLGNAPKYFSILGSVLILVMIIVNALYGKPLAVKKNFSLPIVFIFLGVLVSMISCYAFHNQPVTQTFIEQKEMYFYLGYFMLPFLKIRPKELERLILIYALLFIVFYLIQFFIYPEKIFQVNMMKDRGTIRIGLQGVTYIVIGYFILLQRFLLTTRILNIIGCALILVIAILLGGRQLISVLAFMTIINLIFSKRIRSRGIIYTLTLLSIIPLFFMFRNIFGELFKATQTVLSSDGYNVRINAARYFILHSFPNSVSYITGNGMPSATSGYGREIALIISKYKYFLDDIGILGNYYIFGGFFVAGVIMILFRVLRMKVTQEFGYLKYFFISIALMLPMGGGFAYSEFILPMTILLYMADVSGHYYNEGRQSLVPQPEKDEIP